MKLDVRHLVQLAAVAQAGGVTEGAALLGFSQPALSRTLSMLEKRVGEPLFVKGRRPLQPTPLGRALAEYGQLILAASRAGTIEAIAAEPASVAKPKSKRKAVTAPRAAPVKRKPSRPRKATA